MLAKGAISGRPFEPDKAGGIILKLVYQKAKITERGVNLVEFHVRRFNPVGQEDYGLKEGFGILFHPSVEDFL